MSELVEATLVGSFWGSWEGARVKAPRDNDGDLVLDEGDETAVKVSRELYVTFAWNPDDLSGDKEHRHERTFEVVNNDTPDKDKGSGTPLDNTWTLTISAEDNKELYSILHYLVDCVEDLNRIQIFKNK